MMQEHIRVERLPKLDKVLRVTFSSVKKDILDTQDEFSHLQETVNNSLEIFRERIENVSQSAESEIAQKTESLDKVFTSRVNELEKGLDDLSGIVETFIKKTNTKVSEWNTKIRKLDENSARASEIGKEIKAIKLLKAEFEEIKFLKKQVEIVEKNSVPKKFVEKEISDLQKELNTAYDKLSLNAQLIAKKIDDKLSMQAQSMLSEQQSTQSQLQLLEKKSIERVESESKALKTAFEEDKKLQSKQLATQKDNFEKKFVEAEKDIESFADELSKTQDDLKKTQLLVDEQKKTIDAYEKTIALHEKTISDSASGLKELKDQVFDTIKELKQKFETSLRDQKLKYAEDTKKLKQEVSSLQKDLRATSKKQEVSSSNGVVKSIKKESPGFFKRVLDFLIEDVPEEETMKSEPQKKTPPAEKPAKPQKSEKPSKVEKVEIKEIKEL